MKRQYGPERGERVFYASINAGKITGAEETKHKIARELSRHRRRTYA